MEQRPMEAVASTAGGVVLRVKRRRDAQAPQQIVLEATSRTAALASDFDRALGVGSTAAEPADQGAATAPPRKRCRFVLFKAAAVPQGQEQQTDAAAVAIGQTAGRSGADAAAGREEPPASQPDPAAAAAAAAALPPGCTRVLDLWHTPGMPQTSTNHGSCSSSTPAAVAAAAAGGHHLRHEQYATGTSAANVATASTAQQRQLSVYEEMVQQYLQQHPGPPAAAAAATAAQKSHKPHIPPSRRAHRYHAAQEPQQQQQQQQQEEERVLPEYMTREMLQQYGLLSKITGHMQPHVATTIPPAAAAAAAPPPAAAAAAAAMDDDQEYVYDVYVPINDDEMEAVELIAGEGQGSMPVVQVWEEDMQEFDDLWTAGPGTGAAADDDSEDSNAEGYYANSYPDEDDGYQSDGYEIDSYHGGGGYADSDGSYGSSEQEECYGRGGGWGFGSSSGMGFSHHTAAAAANLTVLDAPGSEGDGTNGRGLITCYQRRSRPQGQHHGVRDEPESDDSIDAGAYASADEQEQQQQGLVGGAAWRAVLAAQFAPGQREEM